MDLFDEISLFLCQIYTYLYNWRISERKCNTVQYTHTDVIKWITKKLIEEGQVTEYCLILPAGAILAALLVPMPPMPS